MYQPLQRDYRSIHGQDVQQAVVVEVEPAGPPASVRKAGGAEPRACVQVLEPPGPVVHKKVASLTRQVRHDEVLVPIVVEVPGVDAHARVGVADCIHGSS